MPGRVATIAVYLELGTQKTIAGAIDWPGWNRIGRDEASALQALFDSAPRYARVVRATRSGFHAPEKIGGFRVVERLKGDSTTDFGAPNIPPHADAEPLDAAAHQRLRTLLNAGWRAFDAAVASASGRKLRLGPRGGGRDIDRLVEHVVGAEASYLSALGWKYRPSAGANLGDVIHETRQAILAGLTAAARGEVPARGPRGGVRWTPRYFVRRLAWHALDHAWEIADRLL